MHLFSASILSPLSEPEGLGSQKTSVNITHAAFIRGKACPTKHSPALHSQTLGHPCCSAKAVEPQVFFCLKKKKAASPMMDVCQLSAASCTANCSFKTKKKSKNNFSSPAQPPERTGSSEISSKQKSSESPHSWCPLAQAPSNPQSHMRWWAVHSSCAQGVSRIEIPQLTSLLTNNWQIATGFQTVCKLKVSFRVSCKTVGEMLAYSSFPFLSLSSSPALSSSSYGMKKKK